VRHKYEAKGVVPGLRQVEADSRAFGGIQIVRDLHQHAGAIADQRIGADGAAMGEVFQNLQAIGNDRMGGLAFHMGDKSDAAGIVVVAAIIKASGGGFERRIAGSRRSAPGRSGRLAAALVAQLRCCHPLCHAVLLPTHPASVRRHFRRRAGLGPLAPFGSHLPMRLEPWVMRPALKMLKPACSAWLRGAEAPPMDPSHFNLRIQPGQRSLFKLRN
jgi:hypothetical protein